MKPNRLGYAALSAFSAFFLLGCPTPVDMHDPDANGGSSGARGGSTGSGTGGSTGSGTGGSSSSGTGGSSSGSSGGSTGAGGSASGRGGSTGSGGSTGRGGAAGADAGGGGAMDMAAANGTKLPPDIAAIITMRCGTCHDNQYRDPAMAYTRLKGMAGAPCSRPRMVPGMGAMSLVVQSMKGMKPCGANMKMPPGAAPMVPAADIMKVEQWITDGAKPVP